MRRMHVMVILVAAALLSSSAASADQTIYLQRDTIGYLAVDDAHGHVFISGGYNQNDGTVDVYGFDGVHQSSIGTYAGLEGMAISGSTLYVASCGTSSIEMFSLSTLGHTGTISLAHTMDFPGALAVAGGRLWFDAQTDGAQYASPGSVTIAAPHTEDEPAALSSMLAPTFATSASRPNMLVVSDLGDVPGDVKVVDVSAATPTITATGSGLARWGTADNAAIAPDGDVLLPFDSEVRAYSATDLHTVDSLYTGRAGASKVTVSPDGTYLAVGVGQGVDVYGVGDTTPFLSDATDADGWGAPAYFDMAFAADDSKLFAIAGTGRYSTQLVIIDHPTLAGTSLVLDASASPMVAGASVAISGKLSNQSGAPLGSKQITIRALPPSGGGWQVIGAVTSAGDGTFSTSTTDTLEAGTWYFDAVYAGNATYHGTAKIDSVALDPTGSTLTLHPSSSTVLPGAPLSLSGALTLAVAGSPAGKDIQLSETPPGGSRQPLATVQTDASGGYSFDLPDGLPQGTTVFDARFAGDAAHLPSTQTTTVVSDRLTTTLSIKAPTTIVYGGSATLAIHLGPHDLGEVSVYRQASGGFKRLIEVGQVDAEGNLRIPVQPKRDTQYTASFAGDTTYKPVIKSRSIGVRAIVHATMLGGYATSGGNRLYHYTSLCVTDGRGCPEVEGTVIPNKQTEYVTFVLQVSSSGRWVKIATAKFRLSKNSTRVALVHYVNRSMIGRHQRARVIYAGDGAMHGNTSPWRYFEVTD
jgi:hypothetical protein